MHLYFVQHVDVAGHLPDWNGASILCKEFQKKHRQDLEAAFISTLSTLNGSVSKVKLSRYAAQLLERDLAYRGAT